MAVSRAVWFIIQNVILLTRCCVVGFILLIVANVLRESVTRLPLNARQEKEDENNREVMDALHTYASYKDHPTNTTRWQRQYIRTLISWRLIKVQGYILRTIILDVIMSAIIKSFMFCYSFLFFFVSSELSEYKKFITSPTYLQRPTTRPLPESIIKEKRIIFIRHGESMWNMGFNRTTMLAFLPCRILHLLGTELGLFCQQDSVLWDSPLSSLGKNQASWLRHWLQTEFKHTPLSNIMDQDITHDDLAVTVGCETSQDKSSENKMKLRNARQHAIQALMSIGNSVDFPNHTILTTSNLRRAIETAIYGLPNEICSLNESSCDQPNIMKSTKPIIYVLSSLQEATRNIDGHSFSMVQQLWSKLLYFGRKLNEYPIVTIQHNLLNQTFNHGAKALCGESLLQRLFSFASWIMDNQSITVDANTIISVGHSIWLQKFLHLFLPTLEGNTDYWIDPESVIRLYNGFNVEKIATYK